MAKQAAETLSPGWNATTSLSAEGAAEEGDAEHCPFDVILINGGVEADAAAELTEQLKEGGRLVAIHHGSGAVGQCRVTVRSARRGDSLSYRPVFDVARRGAWMDFGRAPSFSVLEVRVGRLWEQTARWVELTSGCRMLALATALAALSGRRPCARENRWLMRWFMAAAQQPRTSGSIGLTSRCLSRACDPGPGRGASCRSKAGSTVTTQFFNLSEWRFPTTLQLDV